MFTASVGTRARRAFLFLLAAGGLLALAACSPIKPPSVPVRPPTITTLAPDCGPEAGGNFVNIFGTGLAAVEDVVFGTEFSSGGDVISDTHITAEAPPGTGIVDLTVFTPTGFSADSAADDYEYAPEPTLTGMSSTVGPAEGSNTVVITGTGFTCVDTVTFGATLASSFTVDSETQISAVAPAGTGGTGGLVDIRVFTAGGVTDNTTLDDYRYGPTVTMLSPALGHLIGGQLTTITGTGFGAPGSGVTQSVSFGGTNVPGFTVVNNQRIDLFPPPHSQGTVDVIVTTLGGTNANTPADDYNYVAFPTVTDVSPDTGSAAGGDTVVITGTGFLCGGVCGASTTDVEFGPNPAAAITVDSDTQITVLTPADTGAVNGVVNVRVITPGGNNLNTANDDFGYGPTVTMVSPAVGSVAGGQSVTITGTGFGAGPAGRVQSVTIGGDPVPSFTVVDDTTLTATTPGPHAAGVFDVVVTTDAGPNPNTAADNYRYAPIPDVTDVNPDAGPELGGNTVIVTGTGFTDATNVDFGTRPATTFTVNSDTQITVTAPARDTDPNTQVNVKVTTVGGQSPANNPFNVYEWAPVPTVTSLSQTEGPEAGGNTVTITGTGLKSLATFFTTTAVKFGATDATSFTVVSDTQIMATVPAGTGTVDVTVTTPGGTSSTAGGGNDYSYVPAPTVTDVNPNIGLTVGGTPITITGTNFRAGSAVTVGGVACMSIDVVNDTTITCTTPPHAAGTVNVTVTTAGGSSADNGTDDDFTYVP